METQKVKFWQTILLKSALTDKELKIWDEFIPSSYLLLGRSLLKPLDILPSNYFMVGKLEVPLDLLDKPG